MLVAVGTGLVLSIIVSLISAAFNYRAAPDASNIGVIVLPWFLSLVVPSFLIAWPIANSALCYGFAGTVSAVTGGALAGSVIIIAIRGGPVSERLLIPAIVVGVICSSAYWFGARRSDPSAFAPRLRESD